MIDQMYKTYRDIASFYVVYIAEAHALDDKRPVPSAKAKGIREHQSLGERCSMARMLVKEQELSVPFYVDTMDNRAALTYKGLPDRLFLIRKDGKLGVAGERGPFGLKPAVDEAGKWLASYAETGAEPPLSHPSETRDR